jgi:signal transduction histidine kinase
MPDQKNGQRVNGLSHRDFRTLLSFLQFDQQDEKHLKALSEVFGPHIPELVDRFHQHLQKFEETAPLLTDELTIKQILESQRQYLERLTQGNYDQHYAKERLKVGQAHNRIGLSPKWYISAYNLYIHLLFPLVRQAYGDDSERVQNAILSLTKVLMLDMQLAIEAYIERQQLEAQIIQSERFAAISQLAAQVAHEIRNPLSSIELNLDLLADEISDEAEMNVQAKQREEAQGLLRSIRSEVERLDDIVSEYLAFARLPRFEFQLESLNTIIQAFCKFVAPQLRQANVTLKTDLQENLPPTLLDDEQIQRALHNFLKNAIEAMDSSGEFSIQTYAESNQVVLRISDTGHGIPQADRRRIFDPFFTTKRSGTGLGLPLAQEIIKQHQGTILCESVVGKGTQFTIKLPMRDNDTGEKGNSKEESKGRRKGDCIEEGRNTREKEMGE